MKITFLGTGTSQGVPVIACGCPVCISVDPRDNRLRTSLLLQDVCGSVVIDTGPDFRQQMLREHVQDLDAVVFTHEHKDHTAGLDDIRAFNFTRQEDMDVYATKRVEAALRKEFSYIFDNAAYPGVPRVKMHTIDTSPFKAGGFEFVPIQVYHYKLPVLGFRIGDFTYITDANDIPDAEKEKISGSKILVLNALRREKHISHFTLDEAMALVDELKPELTFLTHISHQMGTHEETSAILPDHIRLAYDGLSVTL